MSMAAPPSLHAPNPLGIGAAEPLTQFPGKDVVSLCFHPEAMFSRQYPDMNIEPILSSIRILLWSGSM